ALLGTFTRGLLRLVRHRGSPAGKGSGAGGFKYTPGGAVRSASGALGGRRGCRARRCVAFRPASTPTSVPLTSAPPPAPPPPAARVLVVVPTYNEATNVVPLLRHVLALPGGYDVLVVDDGSPDGTADRVREVQAEAPERV